METIEFIALSLATWRLTIMFLQDTGPFGVLQNLRAMLGTDTEWDNKGELGKLFSCPYCLSVWVAAILYIVFSYGGEIVMGGIYVLALAGIASLIEERR